MLLQHKSFSAIVALSLSRLIIPDSLAAVPIIMGHRRDSDKVITYSLYLPPWQLHRQKVVSV